MTDTVASPQDRRLAARELRPHRRVTRAAIALALTAGGTIATIEVVTALAGEPAELVPAARWAAVLRGLAWRDEAVLRTAAGTAVLGALLLLTLLPRHRPRVLPLRGADPLTVAAVGRRALQRSLLSAAQGVPGIARARVRVRGGRFGRRVSVRAATRYRNPANVPDLVHGALTARLSEMDLMHPRRVDVRLTWRKD